MDASTGKSIDLWSYVNKLLNKLLQGDTVNVIIPEQPEYIEWINARKITMDDHCG